MPTSGMKTAKLSAESANQFIAVGSLPAQEMFVMSSARLSSPTAANNSSA